MLYAKIENGSITTTTNNLAVFFPNTSFPGTAPTSFLNENNVWKVVDEETKKDSTYYINSPGDIELVSGIPTRKWNSTARPLDQMKSRQISTVKDRANIHLKTTDWYVIRKSETDLAVPSDIATYRAAVRTECARLETAITNASDVDGIATVMAAQNWPEEV